jgi:hypothetical protein
MVLLERLYLKSYQPVFTCWNENFPGKISWTTSDVPDKVNDRIPEGGDGSTPPIGVWCNQKGYELMMSIPISIISG